MLKKFFIILFASLLMAGICGNVFAADTQTATSTINGVNVNWSYKLNEANQIEELKCTNTSALTGNITVPSTIDGKTVVTLGDDAFKSATQITGVTIPNTVREIGLWAFSGCTSLSSVNLGNVERINNKSFENCTALKSIKIPKTLTKNASGAPFSGCTNLTSIVLEDGMTVLPDYVCANTPITEITIPNTVKEIGLWAFSGCTSLSSVNLGNVERISIKSFENCTALKSIKIPKTLTKNASGAPFSGCTNLTSIVLEDGMTVLPDYVCANTPITEITIPNTVKEIGLWAFSGCTSLSSVDLGNVEKISNKSFENCTALKSIKIPKTLTKNASEAPFLGCTNLTSIVLEDGMTVLPDYVCANTPITEITVPNTVKEIGLWAFKSCNMLKKITILDNVENMGGYNNSPSDLVFENHNEDLTIYCYKDSMAEKYAKKYNIKYVYLTKPSNSSTEEPKKDDTETQKDDVITDTKKDTDIKDTTVATGRIPQTGATMTSLFIILIISISSMIFYMKHKKFRDI